MANENKTPQSRLLTFTAKLAAKQTRQMAQICWLGYIVESNLRVHFDVLS